jgi:hypothetical protein
MKFVGERPTVKQLNADRKENAALMASLAKKASE